MNFRGPRCPTRTFKTLVCTEWRWKSFLESESKVYQTIVNNRRRRCYKRSSEQLNKMLVRQGSYKNLGLGNLVYMCIAPLPPTPFTLHLPLYTHSFPKAYWLAMHMGDQILFKFSEYKFVIINITWAVCSSARFVIFLSHLYSLGHCHSWEWRHMPWCSTRVHMIVRSSPALTQYKTSYLLRKKGARV